MASLDGKVAIITGSSRGIGKAVAKRLAANGAYVVINYKTDSVGADQVLAEIGAQRAMSVQADVSKLPEIEKLVDATVARFGKVDIVMANAAVVRFTTVDTLTEKDFDEHINLNVKGPMFLVQVSRLG
jgi:3-oxoacyl-[acyl-carrier protein] reductase